MSVAVLERYLKLKRHFLPHDRLCLSDAKRPYPHAAKGRSLKTEGLDRYELWIHPRFDG